MMPKLHKFGLTQTLIVSRSHTLTPHEHYTRVGMAASIIHGFHKQDQMNQDPKGRETTA